MKHLRKFNESSSVSNDVLSYLKGIKHSVLQEVISDLEKELQEDEPDSDKLMAYADDIANISEDEGKSLGIDDAKVDIIYSEIYDIVSKIEKDNEDKEWRSQLPPEEGGPSYKEKSIDEFLMYLSSINNDESYDSEGRQQDINVLIKKFKKGEKLT